MKNKGIFNQEINFKIQSIKNVSITLIKILCTGTSKTKYKFVKSQIYYFLSLSCII